MLFQTYIQSQKLDIFNLHSYKEHIEYDNKKTAEKERQCILTLDQKTTTRINNYNHIPFD